MKNSFSPVLRLAFGMTALTLSLVLVAEFFGLIPGTLEERLKARSRLSEALTVQLSNAASRDDKVALELTIASVVQRDPQVLSIALRKGKDEVIAMTSQHGSYWTLAQGLPSTSTNIYVPLYDGEAYWGRVEIAFAPIDQLHHWFGIPGSIFKYLVFTGFSGFLAYFLLLKRTLRALNPDRVVPDRVQSAFDTLHEGVAIVDEHERILLINKALSNFMGKPAKDVIGSKIDEFQWRHWEDNAATLGYPWRIAISERKASVKVPIGIRHSSNEIRNFNVNASCIVDEKGKTSGAIITFSDVTMLEKQNANLEVAVRKLMQAEDDLLQRNNELQFLANHDPMTGCLNRRTLFSLFEEKHLYCVANQKPLTCLMMDLDHFKSINDRFGHSVGDKVIVGLAKVLRSNCADPHLAGRYGGEEFCVVLDGKDLAESLTIAEQIRQEVLANSPIWLENKDTASISIGLTTLNDGASTPDEMVNMADQALYMAKETGRNRITTWNEVFHYTAGSQQHPLEIHEQPIEGSSEFQPTPHVIADTPAETANHIQGTGNLRYEKTVDDVTGMPPMNLFRDRLMQSMVNADRDGQKVAVVSLSVDTADQIAEAFGELEYTKVVKAAGERLAQVLRRNDTVSLVGGYDRDISCSRSEASTFFVHIPQLTETTSVTWIIKRIINSFSASFETDMHEHYLKCSIGVSVFPEDGNEVDTLLRNANIAKTNAQREKDPEQFRFYSRDMSESARQQLFLESGIRQALDGEEFKLHFQPIIDLRSGHVAAAEALLRCTNVNLKTVPIDLVINVAEKTELINRLGEWVVRTSISQVQKWEVNGIYLPMLSINLSAQQLDDTNTGHRILQMLVESGCDPSRFQFEVTETAVLKSLEKAGETLKGLQRVGAQIALDDFGTGQSSLTYLQQLSPDVIKIDRSFIDGIDHSHANLELVRAMINMAQNLGLRAVAEGVENEKQLNVLQSLKCDEMQGYLIAPPMPAEVFSEWLSLFNEGNSFEAGGKNHQKQSMAV